MTADTAPPEALRRLARAISRGEAESELLARRPGRVTVRADTPDGAVIVKLWNLSDPRSRLRRLAGRTKGQAEWRALSRLHPAGAAVPEPLGLFRLGPGSAHHEALVLRDLAPCTSLLGVLHRHSKAGDLAALEPRAAAVVALTVALLDAGVIDNDHRVGNFVERADGSIWRIDFENATRPWPGPLRDRAIGTMLGALLGSHAWACRDTPEATRSFGAGLARALRPAAAVHARARMLALAELRRLRAKTGFDLDEDLGW